MKDLGNYKREDSIPDINIDIDPFNGGGYHSKYITTPDGKKARVNIRVTGELFKELQKHKFIINKDNTIDYKDPHRSASESVSKLFGVAETYKKSLPLSERMFMWVKTKRNKNKLFDKIYTKWLKRQQRKFFYEPNIATEEFEKIKALGGHVILGMDTDGNQSYVPIEKVTGGFKLPDGYKIFRPTDGVNIPGFGKPKEKTPAEKYTPPTPKQEDVKQESKNPPFSYDADKIAESLPEFDEIFTKAHEINKNKHSGATTEVHKEHFGDLIIESSATKITSKIDELPSNWEYPTKDMVIDRDLVILEQDVISKTVEIVDDGHPTQDKHTTDNTNDLNK